MLAEDLAVFAACAGAILVAGSRLVRHADRLALATGLGGTRVGILLLATATSVPEIVAATTAARLGLPNLAAGNLLGTVPLNLSVLALAALARRDWLLLPGARRSHPRMLWAGFLVTATAAGLLLLGPRVPAVAGVGVGAPLLVAGYPFVAARPSRPEPAAPLDAPQPRAGIGRSLAWFCLHAALVAAAAMLLPGRAAAIADATGLARPFVGAAFLAVATTLPELAVAVAAVRIGARDLAIGNAFGSLLFNLALLGALDLAYTPGSLVGAADASHVFTAIGGLVMFTLLRAVPANVASPWPAWALLALHAATLATLYVVA